MIEVKESAKKDLNTPYFNKARSLVESKKKLKDDESAAPASVSPERKDPLIAEVIPFHMQTVN